MTSRIENLVMNNFHRLLSGDAHDGGDHTSEGGSGANNEDHSEFGVHITYHQLYHSIIFFAAIYVAGAIAHRLKMPSLVGEIFAGIILGPPLLEFVPNPEAFVMLGEIGLILLVLEAGIDIDLTMLKLIGPRGIVIAIVGSILPIAIGIGIAFAIGTDAKGSIAAGAAFGPTSLGIAMNILRSGKIINTPVGQLIVSAAVIDDMIALVILSQLSALVGDVSVASILVPIVSALGFLVLGGYLAVYVLPGLLERFVLSKVAEEQRGRAELAIMLGLLLGLMPATYYARASFLMGAFVAGLTFCRSQELHHLFVSQFKRLLQWLMRIFFAASIGFQVPVRDFSKGIVIYQGLIFTLALLGKLAVGFMVPNFSQSSRFKGVHLRDCLVTGFSMAAEGEFAFVIAVFAVDSDLISKDLYASIVLAVLFSTIVPPFLLRYVIQRFNKRSEERVRQAAKMELQRQMSLTIPDKETELIEGIKNHTTVFLCIQTQSNSGWGLLPKIMQAMNKLGIDVIDHRSWHPRGVDTTLVNEIYVKDTLQDTDKQLEDEEENQDTANTMLNNRMEQVKSKLLEAINQPQIAKVKVVRWYPGIIQEIVEDITDDSHHGRSNQTAKTTTTLNVSELLAHEAAHALEREKEKQTNITKQKSIKELLKDVVPIPDSNATAMDQQTSSALTKTKPRRRRQKMMSSPVIGGDLWSNEHAASTNQHHHYGDKDDGIQQKNKTFWEEIRQKEAKTGQLAELIVGKEVYSVRIAPGVLNQIRKGYRGGSVLGDLDVFAAKRDDVTNHNYEHKLTGFVRGPTLPQITEESIHEDGEEELSEVDENGSVDRV